MNLLTVGAALGVTVAVFQWGWFGSLLGVQKGPIEAWVPVIMFAVVFGLSMDYEVFLDLAHTRAVAAPGRRLGRRGRGRRAHRARDHRGRGDHGLRVPLVRARRRAHAQGVRLRARRRRVPRRPRRALHAAAGLARAARPDHLAPAALARRPTAPHQHRGLGRPGARRAARDSAARTPQRASPPRAWEQGGSDGTRRGEDRQSARRGNAHIRCDMRGRLGDSRVRHRDPRRRARAAGTHAPRARTRSSRCRRAR